MNIKLRKKEIQEINCLLRNLNVFRMQMVHCGSLTSKLARLSTTDVMCQFRAAQILIRGPTVTSLAYPLFNLKIRWWRTQELVTYWRYRKCYTCVRSITKCHVRITRKIRRRNKRLMLKSLRQRLVSWFKSVARSVKIPTLDQSTIKLKSDQTEIPTALIFDSRKKSARNCFTLNSEVANPYLANEILQWEQILWIW